MFAYLVGCHQVLGISSNHLSKKEVSLSSLCRGGLGCFLCVCALFSVKRSGENPEKTHLSLQMSDNFHLKVA